MQDKDWKILKVSKDEPREWKNPSTGMTIYYHKVMLEGYDKPVSVGKQKPHSLTEGQEIYGHPEIAPGMPEDKWKGASKQGGFAGGGFSSAGQAKPAYKDNSDGQRQGMCFNNAANYVNKELSPSNAQEWADSVFEYAQALYAKGDLGSSESEGLKAPPAHSPAPTTSKPWKVNSKTDKLWPSEREDDPEFASLLAKGMQADDIPLAELPPEYR